MFSHEKSILFWSYCSDSSNGIHSLPKGRSKNTPSPQQVQSNQGQSPKMAMSGSIQIPVLEAAHQMMPIGHDDINWYCVELPMNCWVLDPIVIHGVDVKEMTAAANNGPTAVGNLFSSYKYAQVCDSLPTAIATKLKSGTYAIKVVADTIGRFDFIANANSVSNSNFEFAVQLGH